MAHSEGAPRPRLLLPVTIQFTIRYLLRTGLLDALARFTTPIVVISWTDPELDAELEAAGATVVRLPDSRFGPAYVRSRHQMDAWYNRRLASPSTAIDERRVNLDQPRLTRAIRRGRRVRNAFLLRLPGAERRLRRQDQHALLHDTNISDFNALLERVQPDAILSFTPFHRQEELLLRAAALRRIPQCTAILSFDNLTTRGWIPVVFDKYLLWNRHNERELRRGTPEAAASPSVVVGPAQFDFYFEESLVIPEPEWRRDLGLPPTRPVILFGAGPREIVPHEPLFLAQLDDAISRGEIAGAPIILFRRHPMDSLDRWSSVLAAASNVIVQEPWESGSVAKHSNIRRRDIAMLVSTLRHSAVHVNVSSTMTVDGAVFDRPQVGPAYDDQPGRRYDRMTRELYAREHFLPIVESGGLTLVHSRAELVRAVSAALADPAAGRDGRRRLVTEICSFTDGRSTERVAQEVAAFLVRAS